MLVYNQLNSSSNSTHHCGRNWAHKNLVMKIKVEIKLGFKLDLFDHYAHFQWRFENRGISTKYLLHVLDSTKKVLNSNFCLLLCLRRLHLWKAKFDNPLFQDNYKFYLIDESLYCGFCIFLWSWIWSTCLFFIALEISCLEH